MTLLPLALVLGSCVLHAYWNLLFKQAHNKMAFTAIFLSVTPLLYLPVFLGLVFRSPIPPLAWWCILGTGIAYAGYFQALGRAYESGELSVVYPLARSVGPALTLVWAVVLLDERPTTAGLTGICLTLIGATLVQWRPSPTDAGPLTWRVFTTPSTPAALFVALMYSIYSLIDKVGVGRLHVNPAVYIYLTYTACAVLVVPRVVRRYGAALIVNEWRVNAKSCVAVAAINMLAYLMVLCAMALPHTPVSYITPLRTVSVLIGLFFGVEVLKEAAARTKMMGAVLMACGVALMAWKG